MHQSLSGDASADADRVLRAAPSGGRFEPEINVSCVTPLRFRACHPNDVSPVLSDVDILDLKNRDTIYRE